MADNRSRITNIVFDQRTVHYVPKKPGEDGKTVLQFSLLSGPSQAFLDTDAPAALDTNTDHYDIKVEQGHAQVISRDTGDFTLFISKQPADQYFQVMIEILSNDGTDQAGSVSFSIKDYMDFGSRASRPITEKANFGELFKDAPTMEEKTRIVLDFIAAAAPYAAAASNQAKDVFLRAELRPLVDGDEAFYQLLRDQINTAFGTDYSLLFFKDKPGWNAQSLRPEKPDIKIQ